MSDSEFHGWAVVPMFNTEKPGESLCSLHIGRLPGRKQVCLYGHNGTYGVINVYAFFKTEGQAREAMAILDRLMKR